MSACLACSRDQCDRCRGGSCACCGEVDEEMDMLETEKATDQMDLPHEFDRIGPNDKDCVCGRPEGNPLHQPVSTEQAAHSAPLQTEKGT